jgi:hypothetical protein
VAGPVSPGGVLAAGNIRLYIAGLSPNSLRAQQNLRDATNAMNDPAVRLNVEVIDVFKGPKRAIADGILVTPTLIAHYSGKRVVMVGDLGDASALRSILDACVEFPRSQS